MNGSSKQILKSLRMLTGIEMKKNSKTGVKIIIECWGLMKRQVVHGNREGE